MLAFLEGKLLLKLPQKRPCAKKRFSSETKCNHTESKYWLSCTSYQSFQEIWCTRVGKREIFKTWMFSNFVSSNAISLHDFKLTLCMLGRYARSKRSVATEISVGHDFGHALLVERNKPTPWFLCSTTRAFGSLIHHLASIYCGFYHISLVFHSCSLVFHSCSLVFHSCSIRVPPVFHPCSLVFIRVH